RGLERGLRQRRGDEGHGERDADALEDQPAALDENRPVLGEVHLALRRVSGHSALFVQFCGIVEFGHQKNDSFTTMTSLASIAGSGSLPARIRPKLTSVSTSLPSGLRCLIRMLFEARSVRPPARATTDSSVSRSSVVNSRAPGALTSPMQKTRTCA